MVSSAQLDKHVLLFATFVYAHLQFSQSSYIVQLQKNIHILPCFVIQAIWIPLQN